MSFYVVNRLGTGIARVMRETSLEDTVVVQGRGKMMPWTKIVEWKN